MVLEFQYCSQKVQKRILGIATAIRHSLHTNQKEDMKKRTIDEKKNKRGNRLGTVSGKNTLPSATLREYDFSNMLLLMVMILRSWFPLFRVTR